MLQAERRALLFKIGGMDRINRTLVETIDAFPNDENKENDVVNNNNEYLIQAKQRISQLKQDVETFKERIDNLSRDNSNLRSENGRLMACLKTYGDNVLDEHNYNM